jgi:hypothetical protein
LVKKERKKIMASPYDYIFPNDPTPTPAPGTDAYTEQLNQKLQATDQRVNQSDISSLQSAKDTYAYIQTPEFKEYSDANDRVAGRPIGSTYNQLLKQFGTWSNETLTPLTTEDYKVAEPSASLKPTNYSTGTQRYAVPQSFVNNQGNAPSNYTGYVGNTPYVSGQAQTSGGGYYTDPSTGKVVYSAGYHGGGAGNFEDRGQWGTGMNMGPMVNGTVQTGGGGFTPDGSYSTGYHGSGEHPEITGESTPGVYKSGSFGSIIKPDLSNGIKVEEFLKYVNSMGFDTTGVNKRSLEDQYNQGTFGGLKFIESLPQSDANKTALIQQYAGNPMMPTKDVQSLLGGGNFANLFAATSPTQATTQTATPATTPSTLNNLGSAVQQDFQKSYINPYTGSTETYKRKRYKLYT